MMADQDSQGQGNISITDSNEDKEKTVPIDHKSADNVDPKSGVFAHDNATDGTDGHANDPVPAECDSPGPSSPTHPVRKKRRRTLSAAAPSPVARSLSIVSVTSSHHDPGHDGPSESKENETAGNDSINFFTMPKEKKFVVITFCFANFCVGAFYSLLGPFFPQEVRC